MSNTKKYNYFTTQNPVNLPSGSADRILLNHLLISDMKINRSLFDRQKILIIKCNCHFRIFVHFESFLFSKACLILAKSGVTYSNFVFCQKRTLYIFSGGKVVVFSTIFACYSASGPKIRGLKLA